MNLEKQNQNFLRMMLSGNFELRFYDRENKLTRVLYSNNVITTNGLNRLIDMLMDGYNYFSPELYPDETKDVVFYPTLKDSNNFNGGQAGEIFGINFIQWNGKYKSTFTQHGIQDSTHFKYPDNMFKGKYNVATQFIGDYRGSDYWFPGGETEGYICDLGWTKVEDEIFNAPTKTYFYNLKNKNLYYGYMKVQNMDKTETYTENTDYEWKTGDGDNYGQIKILNDSLVGTNLKVSYYWYDVPQVPIVGFAIRASGSFSNETFFHSWRWSLNQGKDRTRPFFPFCNGNPRRPGWQWAYSNWARYPIWYGDSNMFYTYFFNSLPWAVKNPVQLAWFGMQNDRTIYISDFELLGLKMPKLGCHAIGLGNGNGIISVNDTNLFDLKLKKITERKTRLGEDVLKIVSHIDYDEGNDINFTEIGMFYPAKEDVYFKEDEYWTGSLEEGNSGEHSDYISGTNKILKLSPIEVGDCDTLMSHAFFDTSWSKTDAERIEIIYKLNVNWGD